MKNVSAQLKVQSLGVIHQQTLYQINNNNILYLPLHHTHQLLILYILKLITSHCFYIVLFNSWSLCLKLTSQGWWVEIELLGTWIGQSDSLSVVSYSSWTVRYVWKDRVKNLTWHKDAGLPLTGFVWKKAITQSHGWKTLATLILCVNAKPPCTHVSVLPITYSWGIVDLLSNLHGSVQLQVIAAVFKEKGNDDSAWNTIIPIFMGKSEDILYIYDIFQC